MNATLQELDSVNERQGIRGLVFAARMIVCIAGAVAWTF
jgi:hypothetical protein